MHPELETLLILQRDDEALRAVESELASLNPRIASLDKAKQRAKEESARAETSLARELERFHALEARISEHRQRHDKNLATLNQAHKLREATAAMAQVETAKKVVAEEESELLGLSRRLTDLRSAATATRDTLDTLELEQADARAAIEVQRSAVGERIKAALQQRTVSASKVSKTLLARYERMNTRLKGQSVFALRSFSCGNCDTAVSMQRRPALQTGQIIETCEECGVLLYFEVVPTAAAAKGASV